MSQRALLSNVLRRSQGRWSRWADATGRPSVSVSVSMCAAASACNEVVAVSSATVHQVRTSLFHTSPAAYDKQKVKVPTMGDSITEGTIVEWVAEVGQAVQPDDVVALVETDKVTIDIKAEQAGVITAHFGSVEDTVEVGADLYEIDSEATATVKASDPSTGETGAPEADVAPAKNEEDEEERTAKATSESPSSSTGSKRVPSIKFLGKEGWAKRRAASKEDESVSESPVIYTEVPPNFGRPQFTEEEMDALVLGGANLAPDVLQQSGGATFG